jgi:hypothetical protein
VFPNVHNKVKQGSNFNSQEDGIGGCTITGYKCRDDTFLSSRVNFYDWHCTSLNIPVRAKLCPEKLSLFSLFLFQTFAVFCTLYVFFIIYLLAYKDGKDSVFRNVGI